MSEETNNILSIIAWVIIGIAAFSVVVGVLCKSEDLLNGGATQKAIEFCGCDNKTCIITYTKQNQFDEDTWRKLCWEEKK